MRRSIWKFTLDITDRQEIEMPVGASIIAVQIQGSATRIALWAVVDTDVSETQTRKFAIVGTGHPLPEEPNVYLGTLQMMGGQLVWHVFELRRGEVQ